MFKLVNDVSDDGNGGSTGMWFGLLRPQYRAAV